MPGFDGTGPGGRGPMTGGGRGYCTVTAGRSVVRPAAGFFRRGGGRGRRNMYYATGMPGWQRAAYGYPAYGGQYPYAAGVAAGEEKEALRAEAELLRQELSDIQSRIDALEKDGQRDENK